MLDTIDSSPLLQYREHLCQRFNASRPCCLLCLLALSFTGRAIASAYDGKPKLVVILVIDQFRGDYLERYRADFKGHGFRLFLDHGAYFPDCYYDYANTNTAPGHATIGTGAYTDGHGIGTNEWWDLSRNKQRPVTSVEDERYGWWACLRPRPSKPEDPADKSPSYPSAPRHATCAPPPSAMSFAWPRRASRTLFGISLKDRSAILPAGATANAAYWIDPASGHFITSTFYRAQLPDWAAAFNTGGRPEQAERGQAPQPADKFYDEVGRTPAANAYELDFARALIKGEQLGKHATTDMLTISASPPTTFSATRSAPTRASEQLMVDGLDTDLDSFFTWLDKNVDGGLANVWIALSADHGVAPVPADAAKLGMNAAVIDMTRFSAALNDAMNLKFSPGEKVDYLLPRQGLPYLALNRPAFDRAGINESRPNRPFRTQSSPR